MGRQRGEMKPPQPLSVTPLLGDLNLPDVVSKQAFEREVQTSFPADWVAKVVSKGSDYFIENLKKRI